MTRIEARSERFDMFMHLDVNTEIYPMGEGQKFTMALATTLNLDGTPDTGYYTPVIFYRYQDKKLVPSNSSAIIQFRVDFFVLLLLFVKFTILYLDILARLIYEGIIPMHQALERVDFIENSQTFCRHAIFLFDLGMILCI